jgi:fumarate reductase subunit C
VNWQLFALQRASAFVLAVLVLVHLATIAVAVQNGLTADEILSRTRGSTGWGLFYGLFVVMASIHGSIGLHAILSEWLGLRRGAADVLAALAALVLLALGTRAVWAVTAGAAP